MTTVIGTNPAPPKIIVALGPVDGPPGSIVIDYGNWQFRKDGVALPLTRTGSTRFRIVAAMLSSQNGFIAYRDLFDNIWGSDPDGGPASSTPAYVMATVGNYHVKLPNTHTRVLVTDWLGFHYRALRTIGFKIDWRGMTKG